MESGAKRPEKEPEVIRVVNCFLRARGEKQITETL
jgi:hypothetical protein